MAVGSKTESKAAAAGNVRPYAIHADELNPPSTSSETAGRRKAEWGWEWILACLGGVALLVYTRVWPALHGALYRPTPLRDYLLPPSGQPIYVIGGVGVGWFWILFVAAPVMSIVVAALWWTLLGWSNHQARTGDQGYVRPGQKWLGQRYPSGPLILLGAAVAASGAGVVLRWAAVAATTLIGRLLLVALLAAAGWALAQFACWAHARARITRQINAVTFLLSPALGWRDLRAGRVRVVRCCYPPRQPAFPKVVKLFYSQHSRTVCDELIGEAADVLHEVIGRTYRLDHDPLSRTLIATETVVIQQDTAIDAQAVLEPLVASWFDPVAAIASVTVDKPQIVIDEDGNTVEETRKPQLEQDAEQAAVTENDAIAERIREFTIEFVYNLKVSSAYRRGVIEGMVADALGGSWEADWSMVSQRARFVRCPGLPTLVEPPLEFPVVNRATIRKLFKQTVIPFAVDAYGNVIAWDFKQSPHFLIAGATSTGKTSLLMTVATQCARRGFNVVWIDPKGFDSPGMLAWPNVSLVTAGFDDDGMVGHTAALRFIADTMRKRLAQVKINPNRADDFDPIIVITDEFSNLVVALAEFYTNHRSSKEKGVPPTTIDVEILLRTARAVGIHMAIGIQRPDTMYVAGEARDNTALRVAMGRLRSKDAAIMMFNDPVAGTRLQPGIKGRGTVQLPDGRCREIQAFYTPKVPATDEQRAALSDHEREILRELANIDSFWPRRVIDSALRNYDPDDPEQKALMSFTKIRNSPIVLASGRPDLDPLSAQYVVPRSTARRPTMDDDHAELDDLHHGHGGGDTAADQPTAPEPFGGPVDGYDDDYLPTIDDEYGPPIMVAAHELMHGDLVDVSVDGVPDWRYVHAEPYHSDDIDGEDRLVIPYRDIEDGHNVSDIDVDPYAVLSARRLQMN